MQFYLAVIFFTVLIYIVDMIVLIANKEIFTSLATLFKSIMRRKKDKDPEMFQKVVRSYKNKSRMDDMKRAAERESARNLND